MFTEDINERRETTRLEINAPASIKFGDNEEITGRLVNVSAKGALIQTEGKLVPTEAENCTLSITLPGDYSHLVIDCVEVISVRQEKNQLAVKFKNTLEWLTLFYIFRQKIEAHTQAIS